MTAPDYGPIIETGQSQEDFGILTDTTASIPEGLVRQLNIEIMPYYVHRGLETLHDMVDVKPGEFAEWLKRATILPTTSNHSPGDYLVGIRHLATRVKEIGVIVAVGAARSRLKAQQGFRSTHRLWLDYKFLRYSLTRCLFAQFVLSRPPLEN